MMVTESLPLKPQGQWSAEPSTAAQLENVYEVVASFPGRFPTTCMKIVKSVPKNGAAPSNIVENQQHKLFIVGALCLIDGP